MNERDAYRVAAFDQATASTAFWVHGYEGMKTHWMKLTRDDSPLSVLVEDLFPVVNFYSWNNKDAFCPETFCGIANQPLTADVTLFPARDNQPSIIWSTF